MCHKYYMYFVWQSYYRWYQKKNAFHDPLLPSSDMHSKLCVFVCRGEYSSNDKSRELTQPCSFSGLYPYLFLKFLYKTRL